MKCEDLLRQVLIEKNLPFVEVDGEAAFYGPKIDVQMKVGPAEEESIASVQLDFNSAKKFDLNYIASSGEFERLWIIHRAPLGSHERFVSLLLEFYDGQLPGWLRPFAKVVIGQKEAQGGQLVLQLRDRKVNCSIENLVEQIQPMISVPV
ncbi:MAG: hypothetical protein JNM39_07060 [Bdellovibrionaceae bacterium]|nr:hypothetical protein [Pseudobdellovibrionaceae bacterium]